MAGCHSVAGTVPRTGCACRNVGGWSSSSKHPDKTMQDLTLAKTAAEEARFELARKLTEASQWESAIYAARWGRTRWLGS